MKLSALIDKIGENIDRLKTIGLLIVIVLFIISLVNNGCSRSELEKTIEKVTGLNISNDLLRNDIKHRDSVLIAKNDSIQLLELKIKQSDKRIVKLEYDNVNLQRKYNDIASDLLNIPTDSSYAFLNKVAYPYHGEKKYPFNEPQVKGIHKTYLEHQGLLAINDNLQEQKDELVSQIYLKDSLMSESFSKMAIMKENRRDLEHIIDNKNEEIQIKDKDAKKAKRRKIWSMIGVGTASLIIGFIAGS